MSIIRVSKTKKYFVASNEPFNDLRLSWEARGMMGYLLSKPDDWTMQTEDLLKQSEAGKHKVQRIINELKDAGYMRRFVEQDKSGQLVWITEVYENSNQPDELPDHPVSRSPGFPTIGEPGHIINTEEEYTYTSSLADKENTMFTMGGESQKNDEDKVAALRSEIQALQDELRQLHTIKGLPPLNGKAYDGNPFPNDAIRGYVLDEQESERAQYITALSAVCKGTVWEENRAEYESAADALIRDGVTVEQVDSFAGWWATNGHYRGKPALKSLLNDIQNSIAAEAVKANKLVFYDV